MMETPRFSVSDWHLVKFPDSVEFQCYSGCPTIAMLWIKEVEVAKSVDDLLTPQTGPSSSGNKRDTSR